MKRIFSLLLLLLPCLFVNCLHSQEAPSKGLQQISEPLVKEFIGFLASDEMRGRPAPSAEADRSAEYIAMKLKDFGIKPIDGSYFQPIPFCAADLNIENCRFVLTKSGTNREFALKENFTPLFNTGNNRVRGELVFAGYGITAPEYNYDDYKDIEVSGKIVLVMKQEPRKSDTISTVFNGKKDTEYSDITYKIRNAAEHGAAGLLLVTDPLHNVAITAQGYLWNSLYMKGGANPVYNVCEEEDGNIPAVQVNRDVINEIFGSVDSLRTLQRNIDENLHPASFVVPEAWVDIAISVDKKEFPSGNVIGWLKGSDPQLKDEFIIIGAHYDHIGISPKPNHLNDSIMNGADDNASGTAAVMAVAKAFAASGKKPARSVLFMLFTAEERGLIGSDYYTKNPLFPLEKTVAMINMDMVGRNGNDTAYVIGQQYNPGLAALINAAIPETGLKKEEMAMDLYRSSDYYPFYKKGISAIGLTSGLHSDYHGVGDNPDKINHLKVQKIAQLVYKVAWQIANTNNYYTIIEQ
ncbi:M20/M25/M40 family metallo-hydrolase [uncultured Proteiniphilum sp.]|uniref:M20/M25/M40 family metallo-hydrolase n=1 Tax=uncultured Proteiniphilum sp. TaxID=497637 RepID=UPI0026146EA3|nr:M20/M25/M40 family metallo-hydrolase [uncultured Proteiniphilum sp.]